MESEMDWRISYIGGCAIKMFTSQQSLNARDIRRLLGKFGEIKQIMCHDDFQIIYFASQEDAVRCVHQYQYGISSRIENTDPESTGDTVLKKEQRNIGKIEQSKEVLTNDTKLVNKLPKGNHFTPTQRSSFNVDQFMPNCSSPVLLNTMDPGFRMAYCHNVEILETNGKRRCCSNQFSESVKKYMDNVPKMGSQELILTNLPLDFKKEDIYKLCGKVEPEAVELKKTANINILYANIRTKTRDDFDKLIQILANRQINGMKITTIPITKVVNS